MNGHSRGRGCGHDDDCIRPPSMSATAPRHNSQPSGQSSSSASTAYRGTWSEGTSHATHTDASEYTTAPDLSLRNPQSLDNPQRIRVYRQTASGDRILVLTININIHTLQTHSSYLARRLHRERIDGEDCFVVCLEGNSSVMAVRRMIECIDRRPVALNAREDTAEDVPFPEFLDLSIILWSYKCRIDHWSEVAQHLKDQDWIHDLHNWTPGRLVQWLFIALVFDWPDIFETASRELIVECSELRAQLEQAAYLPSELADIMWEKRQRYMQQTYELIRNIWIGLSIDQRTQRMGLTGAIRDDLARDPINLNIADSLPQDLHHHLSPGKLLKQLQQSIEKVHSRPQHPGIMHDPRLDETSVASNEHGGSLTSRGGRPRPEPARPSLAAGALKDVLGFGKSAISKRIGKRSRGSRQTSEPPMTIGEVDRACDTILLQISNFSRNELQPLDIHGFESLRSMNILPAPS